MTALIKLLFILIIANVITLIWVRAAVAKTNIEILGEKIFSDTSLSQPVGQACISCHSPARAFTDPSGATTSPGADLSHFGNRNAPTLNYMKFSKPLELTVTEGVAGYVGGYFWDGRADSLEVQAKGPLLNPIEMGSNIEYVVLTICNSSSYGQLFREVFGADSCSDFLTMALPFEIRTKRLASSTFDSIASAIAGYERTETFSMFSSKYDRVSAGIEKFTDSEKRGSDLFNDPKTANCVACHVLDKANSASQPLFTDFSYDNLGTPTNPELLDRGNKAVDVGLAATTHRGEDRGRFKVPTLRNIGRTSPYFHNGYFKTLYQVVDFYNTRDTKPTCVGIMSVEDAEKNNCWPQAEISDTMNRKELGNLKLKEQDVLDLVAFMLTIDDR